MTTTAEQHILRRAQNEGRQDDHGEWIKRCDDCGQEAYVDKLRCFYRGGRDTGMQFTVDVLCGRCFGDAMAAMRATKKSA